MPKVSVLIPMYNSRAFVAAAYESVLRQTFADFEVVILDDASTDDSVAIVESYRDSRTRVIRLPKAGYVRNLNIGLDLCEGDYVARFDSDDVMLPERLALQSQFLDRNPDVVACGCQADRIDAAGQIVGPMVYDCEPAVLRYRLLLDSPLPHPGAMYRRSAVLGVGRYREEYYPCEDYDLWSRLGTRGRLANLPETLLHYRVHGNNVSIQREALLIENRQRIRTNHLLELGLVRTAQQALRFTNAMTQPAGALTVADAVLCRAVLKRLCQRLLRDGYPPAEVRYLKRWLRWQATARAAQCRYAAKALWYALAAAVSLPGWR